MPDILHIILNSKDGVTLNTEGTYCDKNISITAHLEDKTVTPTAERQTVTVSEGYAGIRSVVVEAAPIVASYTGKVEVK